MIADLIAQTSYLAEGFLWNMLISVVSMSLGTMLGFGLAKLRCTGFGSLRRSAFFVTSLCRNVPSFVLLFYMASLLPNEISVGSVTFPTPTWAKAALALTFPVVGFCSDQFTALGSAENLFVARRSLILAWSQYFLIIIMASATASVIGVDEIVSRANILAASAADEYFRLVIYGYASAFFLTSGIFVTLAIKAIGKRGRMS